MSGEFDAWEPQPPGPDFTERVLAAEQSDRARRERRGRVLRLGLAAAALAAAAAVPLVLWVRRPAEGEATAAARREVALGRSVAVLEPGASIRWKGSEVEQLGGDVFYRVEPGGPYRVKTAAGTVEVLGTCFRVRIHGTDAEPARATGHEEAMMDMNIGKVGAGAVVGALLTVGVYEGKVRVSSAGQQHSLSAGEAVTLQKDGRRVGEAAPAQGAPDQASPTAPAPSEAERAYAEANRSLVENVQTLNRKMAAVEEQKKQLQQQLDQAQVALARAGGDGSKASKNEFDLSADDWKKLAQDGTVKYKVPCFRKSGWQPSPEALQKLGLAPDDAPALQEVYRKSNERMWGTIRPLCASAVGSESVADKIGPDTCVHLVLDINREKDGEAASEAMRQVGEMRAGLRPVPEDMSREHPVMQVFYALTGELKSFEGDLAQSLGPEEAHRIAFSDGLCAGRSTFGGPGPRKK